MTDDISALALCPRGIVAALLRIAGVAGFHALVDTDSLVADISRLALLDSYCAVRTAGNLVAGIVTFSGVTGRITSICA